MNIPTFPESGSLDVHDLPRRTTMSDQGRGSGRKGGINKHDTTGWIRRERGFWENRYGGVRRSSSSGSSSK